MAYNPYGGYPPPQSPPGGYPPPYGQSPYGQPSAIFMCEQNMGLGGQQQMVPLQYPVNLQFVVQQVQMYLMGQGFNVFPFVGQNMAVIQAQHNSLLGMITDKNVSYTIRICQGNMGGQWVAVVETGITNLMQDLLTLAGVGGGTFLIGDEVLHNKLVELLGGGLTAYDAYNLYKDYANEQQLINTVMMALMSAPPLYQQGMYPQQPGMYPQGGMYQQPGMYPQPGYQPNPYMQPSNPAYPNPPQQPQQQQKPVTPQPQQVKKIKCWKCGEEVDADAKFCPYCGASLAPIKCPKCGYVNQAGAKFCSNCGYQLTQTQTQ
ncbi:zinc-ribbon domain-containing protein [Sulfolobus sp. S-194]|uniref:zinc ribbon domain-containing protein n=1 Tax=Sulfolobus sp. S-194 TaxID=2512240 RepID=UPI001436F65F|nr:zinc-ribbon domain-containing protein [Sulfolobus sp. S-194]QIW23845.1 zinc-ribbon domain-containing protein [Sulfolobus sp. S-194]